jgi:hypothetical protein
VVAKENIKLSLKSKPSSSSYIGSYIGTKVEGEEWFWLKEMDTLYSLLWYGQECNLCS